MKVTIEEGCIGCGACESICDAVFQVDNVVSVNEANVAGNEDAVKEAADSCPVSVIVVEE
jgi:ferredoxin